MTFNLKVTTINPAALFKHFFRYYFYELADFLKVAYLLRSIMPFKQCLTLKVYTSFDLDNLIYLSSFGI